jgi:hypothetical protein
LVTGVGLTGLKFGRTDSHHFRIATESGRVEGVAWSDGLVAVAFGSPPADAESSEVRSTADLALLLRSVGVTDAEETAEELWSGGLGEFADRYWRPRRAESGGKSH